MYESILVGVDGSDEASAALDHAVGLAEDYGAVVTALMVVEEGPQDALFGVEEIDELNRAVSDIVADQLAEYADRDVDISGEVRRGEPTSVLLSFAHQMDADLIVVGQQGGGHIRDILLGSTADRVARLTDIPLAIIPSTVGT